jgi:hypothetical protein
VGRLDDLAQVSLGDAGEHIHDAVLLLVEPDTGYMISLYSSTWFHRPVAIDVSVCQRYVTALRSKHG